MQTLDESEIILWFIRRYEEYPTSPASFVLNGFIYSLLGLYDLNATVPASLSRDAGHLYEQGMISLKKMLLLFDTGSGTIYDLRHFTLGMSGPKCTILRLTIFCFQVSGRTLQDGITMQRMWINYCYLPKYIKILSYRVRPNDGIVTCMENGHPTIDKLTVLRNCFVFPIDFRWGAVKDKIQS